MVNVIWISFLSILVIFFIIYSIFSDKNTEIEEDYDTKIYNNFVKLNKRTKSYKPKESKKYKKFKVGKDLNTTDTVDTLDTVDTVDNVNIISNKERGDTKRNTKGDKSDNDTSDTKDPVKSTIKANGILFKGDFDGKEINHLKKYSPKVNSNRGFLYQKFRDKVTLKKWIDGKKSYNDITEIIKEKSDPKGKYETYIIWENIAEKYLLNGKIK